MRAKVKVTQVGWNELTVDPNTAKTIDLPAGQYQIEMYGGGGAACYSLTPDYPYGAGSGAGFKGVINLQAGTYTIQVGGGKVNASQMGGTPPTYTDTVISSNGVNLIKAGAGEDGIWRNRYGYGGTLTIDNSVDIVSSEIQSDGNHGTYTYYGSIYRPKGGMSLYDGTSYGYGAGGSANEGGTMNGADGYFYIERLDGNIGYKLETKIKVSKKTLRNYYKKYENIVTFNQVVPTSNQVGGNEIACTGGDAKIYNPNNNSYVSNINVQNIYYVPNGLKVSSVFVRYDGYAYTGTGYVECSHDGVTWVNRHYWNENSVNHTVQLNDTEFYKYHKLVGTGVSQSGNITNWLYSIVYTGDTIEKSIEEVLYPQFIERKYYKYTYTDTNSPVFTSNTETDGVSIITGGSNYAITGTNSGTTINTNQIVTFDVGESSGGINSIGFIGVVAAGSYPGAVMTNVQCSEDNENWITISNSFGGRGDYLTNPLVISSPNNYRYIRFTSGVDDNRYSYGGMYMVTINYKKRQAVESTSADYDYYEDIYNYDYYEDLNIYKAIKNL